MKFKINDIIVLNDYGTKQISAGNSLGIKKTTLFIVKNVSKRQINVERMSGNEILGEVSIDLFRLATSMDKKIITIEKTFS